MVLPYLASWSLHNNKHMRTLIAILFICPLILRGQITWSQVSSTPMPIRSLSGYFLIDSSYYRVCGRDTNLTATSEVWEYKIKSNTWHRKKDFIPKMTFAATSVSLNGYGYILCPRIGNGLNTYQMWRYDPVADHWERKTDCPLNTLGGLVFSYDIYIYIYLGQDTNGQNTQPNMYRYNTLTDTWDTRASFPGTYLTRLINSTSIDSSVYMTSAIDNISYIGNTFACRNDLWRYNIHSDTWDSLPTFLGRARQNPFLFGFKNFLLIGFGSAIVKINSITYVDSLWHDMQRFDFKTQSWSFVNYTGLTTGIAPYNSYFQYNHKCYIVGGIKNVDFSTIDYVDTNVWVMDPSPLHPIWLDSTVVTGVEELPHGGEYFRLYPNPSNSATGISMMSSVAVALSVYDALGRQVYHVSLPEGVSTIPLDISGIYFYRATMPSGTVKTGKLIINP
jgi:N-acetylneuraminic acid mutarotase